MKGLIVINAYPNGEKFLRQSERIAAELRLRGVETTVLRNGQISFTVGATGALSLSTQEKYAFAVYLDKDKYLGAALERFFKNPCKIRFVVSAQIVKEIEKAKAAIEEI